MILLTRSYEGRIGMVAPHMFKGCLHQPLVVIGPQAVATLAQGGAQNRAHLASSFPSPRRGTPFTYAPPVEAPVCRDTEGATIKAHIPYAFADTGRLLSSQEFLTGSP